MSESSPGYDLQNILTGLAVRIGTQEGTLKTFMENWATQDKLAHDARRLLYERIELISRQVDRVAIDVQGIQQDVAELKKEIEEDVKPNIESFQFDVQRKIGAKGVWALIVGGVVGVSGILAWVAERFWPKP